MTANTAWRPAPRPGIVPLHPLSFGTILGRSFTALRQNPRVLLGFALVVQTIAYVIVIVAVAAIGIASFSRLDTLQYGTDEFDAVTAGSIAITAIAAIVLGLAVGALSVIVQGIVVTEVAHAVVAEKLTLRALWAQLRPAVWRLLAYALLLSVSVLLLVGAVTVGIIAVGVAVPALAIGLAIVIFLAAIPLYLWLSVKLLLVPSILILEHARIPDAIARSWRLVRGRFWSTLGVFVIVQVAFAALAQAVSLPFSLLTSGIVSILSPTGTDDTGAIVAAVAVAVLTQILTLLVQAVAVVVLSTATALVYVDCRMRHEGLDLDLADYVEQRDAGVTALPDPYRVHVGREIAPRPPAGGFAPSGAYPPGAYPGAHAGYPQGYGAQPPSPAQQYGPPQQSYPAQQYSPAQPPYPAQQYSPAQPPYPAQQYGSPQQPYPQQPPPPQVYGPPQQPYPQQPYPPQAPPPQQYGPPEHPAPQHPSPPADAAPPYPAPLDENAPTRWAAPGRRPDTADPDSPWS